MTTFFLVFFSEDEGKIYLSPQIFFCSPLPQSRYSGAGPGLLYLFAPKLENKFDANILKILRSRVANGPTSTGPIPKTSVKPIPSPKSPKVKLGLKMPAIIARMRL